MYETYLQNERENNETTPDWVQTQNRLSLIKVMKALEKELEEEKELAEKHPVMHYNSQGNIVDNSEHNLGYTRALTLSLDKIREFIKQLEEYEK